MLILLENEPLKCTHWDMPTCPGLSYFIYGVVCRLSGNTILFSVCVARIPSLTSVINLMRSMHSTLCSHLVTLGPVLCTAAILSLYWLPCLTVWISLLAHLCGCIVCLHCRCYSATSSEAREMKMRWTGCTPS